MDRGENVTEYEERMKRDSGSMSPIHQLREEREKLMETISTEMDSMERRLGFILKDEDGMKRDATPFPPSTSRIAQDYREVNLFLRNTLDRVTDITERLDI